MHYRDVHFEHTVSVDVDPDIADAVEEKHVTKKADDLLEDELGKAARWFEHASTNGTDVTYELCVKDAHVMDVSDEEARASAEEYAATMFEFVESPFAVADLSFVEVTNPDDADEKNGPDAGTPNDTDIDTDTDSSSDTVTDTGEQDTLVGAMGGSA